MKDGYTWSGGPYMIDVVGRRARRSPWCRTRSGTARTSPTSTRSSSSWSTDTAAEFQAFKSGQVKMIYPQPQLDVVSQIGAGIPGANSYYNADTGCVRGHLDATWAPRR